MSDGDVDTSSCCADTSFESSLVSKPQTSALESELRSCTSLLSSGPMMHNYLNYDPPVNHPSETSYLSFTYFVCHSIGLGLLCLPHAFKQVGVIIGFALCVIAGLTFTYSFTTLCCFKYKLCQIHRLPTVSYQNLVEYSLIHGPKVIRWCSPFFKFTFIATNLTLNFGKSCLYTKFVSSTIHELITDLGISVNYFNISLGFDVVCMVFLLLPHGEFKTSLHVLSNIACTVLMSFIFYSMFTSDTDIGCQRMICGNLTDVFQFFGVLLFTFIPTFQVFKIESRLNKQNDFIKPFNLLNISMAVITNMFIAIGLCGYLDQQDQLIIGDSILKIKPIIRCRTIVKLCVAVNVTLFHREFNVESTLLWLSSIKVAKMKSDNNKSHPPSTAYYSPSVIAGLSAFTKILFTFCSFFVTITVTSPATNSFLVFVGLIGYLGNTCNMFIYPYIVELCVTHALYGMSTRPYVIAKDVCFVLLGLTVLACGTSALLIRLIHGGD